MIGEDSSAGFGVGVGVISLGTSFFPSKGGETHSKTKIRIIKEIIAKIVINNLLLLRIVHPLHRY